MKTFAEHVLSLDALDDVCALAECAPELAQRLKKSIDLGRNLRNAILNELRGDPESADEFDKLLNELEAMPKP